MGTHAPSDSTDRWASFPGSRESRGTQPGRFRFLPSKTELPIVSEPARSVERLKEAVRYLGLGRSRSLVVKDRGLSSP